MPHFITVNLPKTCNKKRHTFHTPFMLFLGSTRMRRSEIFFIRYRSDMPRDKRSALRRSSF